MKKPLISNHFRDRKPSSIRQAQIKFSKREDRKKVKVINLAIGNVSLPIYPAMKNRMDNLGMKDPFSKGKVPYTTTIGLEETRKGFLKAISALDIDTSKLFINITDGGSSSMEIMMLGVCGPSSKKPILLLDPSYTNYLQFSKRLNIPVLSTERRLRDDGSFAPLNFKKILEVIEKYKPAAIIIIPYDNPTGQFINQKTINKIAEICINNGVWLVSDEAYRPMVFTKENPSSIWKIPSTIIPDGFHFRISIESASKVWNACGLRIGGIVTDNHEFHSKAVSEYTANLCANNIGQYIFGALANESIDEIKKWYNQQNSYYMEIFKDLKDDLKKELPGVIVSKPEASIYCIIDFKNISNQTFDSNEFVNYCAENGSVKINQNLFTVLLAPMKGFYKEHDIGKTQVRIALVESPSLLKITPSIISSLFKDFSRL